MERMLRLSRNAPLWRAGEPANTVATVEKGRLAVQSNGRILGIVTPGMVIGESALATLSGGSPHRTAEVVALEDGTEVVEWGAGQVKAAFDGGDPALMQSILRTMVGQIGRDALILRGALKDQPAIAEPMVAMLQGVVAARTRMREIDVWSGLMAVFTFLAEIRACTERLRRSLVPTTVEQDALLEDTSVAIHDLFQAPEDRDIVPLLAGLVKAEQDREELAARQSAY